MVRTHKQGGAYGPIQKRNFKIAAAEQAKIEHETKAAIGGTAATMLIHFYCAFAKKVAQLKKKHGDHELKNELDILENKWAARGLNRQLLKELRRMFIEGYYLDWCEDLYNLIAAHMGDTVVGCLVYLDLTGDGNINIFDLVTVATRFDDKEWCRSILRNYYGCVAKEKW